MLRIFIMARLSSVIVMYYLLLIIAMDNVQNSLSGKLSQQFRKSFSEALEPVLALKLKSKMINGAGGSTIVKRLPSCTTFIVQNYKTFKCSGTLSPDTGICQGGLMPYEFSINDICYSTSYSTVNDKICFSSGDAISISVVYNVVTCREDNGKEVVLITFDDYKKKCGDQSLEVKYTYIANASDRAHVQIPNRNKHVKCENNTPGRCEFTEYHSTITNPGTYGYSNIGKVNVNKPGSYVNINSGGSYNE